MQRGSIDLARRLCYEIARPTDEEDDMSGSGYGSVDIAEILSAEVERLRAALAESDFNNCNIVGILYYCTKGHGRPCGQIVGSNGAGGFCRIYTGDKEAALQKARELLRDLESNGHRITHADYVEVENDDLTSTKGSFVMFENADA